MTGAFSILDFVGKLHAIERDMHELPPLIIQRACQMVADAARESLGTYQPGWLSLAPETIAHKMRGDSPLLETGAMRDSIEWNASGNKGYVGSNLDRAVWMELGTSRGVPPRPFLASAAAQQEELIHKMAGKAVHAVMRGAGLASAEMRELLHVLHVLKEAGSSLKRTADKLLEDDEDHKDQGR